MSDRQRGPRGLGEYELEGGAFGPVGAGRGEQRDIRAVHRDPRAMGAAERYGRGERGLGRPGSLWRAVLRRIRTG